MNWETARKAVITRDKVCRRCLRPGTDCHHRQVRGLGGTSDETRAFGMDNLILLCRECHSHVHLNPEESYAQGWLVHSWDDPSVVQLKHPETLTF